MADEIVEKFLCPGCKVEKVSGEYYSNKSNVTGRSPLCRICFKGRYHPKVDVSGLIIRNEEEEVKAIVQFLMENPDATKGRAAKALKMRPEVVAHHMKRNAYLNAIFTLAKKKMAGFVPIAVGSFGESLRSKDSDIKYRAASDLLKSEGVLGNQKIDLTINDTSGMTIDELVKIVARIEGKKVEQTIIDAELVK